MAKEDYKGIWIFAEQENGVIESTVFELLAKAHELQDYNKEDIVAVLFGKDIGGLAQTLISYGADKVIVVDDPVLAEYSARPYQAALTQLAKKYKPSIILYGATPLGCDLAPRLMITLNTGLTAGAIELGYDEDGVFYQTTPAYGGKLLSNIVILEKRPQMATVSAKMFTPFEPNPNAKGEIINEHVDVTPDSDYVVVEFVPSESVEINIGESDVIVAGGRGIRSEDDLAQLEEMAKLMNGVLASSRPLVDVGWLPHSRQIGQSAETVKPKLIFNIAISGAIQYVLGMQNADCVVVVNKNPDATLFDYAHYGIVADYNSFVPAFIEELKKRNTNK